MSGIVTGRIWRRFAIILAGVVVVAALAAFGTGLVIVDQLNEIPRIPAFEGLDETKRPSKPAASAESVTMLLVGSDSRAAHGTTGTRAGEPTWKYGAQRTDTIMLAHIPANRTRVYVVSIPRDSWVRVPGHGMAKVNAAFSWGGPPLLVRTIESMSNVRIDHVGVTDFSGFKEMTDAVGGVDVTVGEPSFDQANNRRWTPGTHHLDGEEALLFVRQRYGLPNGDFDRIRRQQQFMQALGTEVTSARTLSRPWAVNDLLGAVTRSVTVDDRLTTGRMRDLALELRRVRSSDLEFMTLPTKGTGMVGDQSVVFLDKAETADVFDAMRHDRMERLAPVR